jgi:hypothetical protein
VWTAADQGLIAWTEDPGTPAASSQFPAAGVYARRVHVPTACADRFGERVLDGIVIAKPGIASMASISPDHHRFHYGVRNEGSA